MTGSSLPDAGRVLPFRARYGAEPLVTKRQLASHLQVTDRTIERWVNEGMPVLRGQRAVRLQLSAVEMWLKRGAS